MTVRLFIAGCLGLTILADLGCTSARTDDGVRVDQAWNEAREAKPAANRSATAVPVSRQGPESSDDVIATVGGRPISRRLFLDLLLRGHGPGVLEQLVVLESARRIGAEAGLSVSEADVESEVERSLQRLTSAGSATGTASLDHQAAQALLDQILAKRNISPLEYRLAMERNAWLRKIVEAELHFTDQQLRDEFARTYGRRAEIRHIQVANLREAQDVRRRLDQGADFAELASRVSANRNSALTGGLLRPFSEDDPEVSALMRKVAFSLQVGEVSNPVRVDDWYHIIRLERIVPAENVTFDDVRADVERRLRSRLTDAAIQRLHATLYEQAEITIHDSALREAVDARRAGAAGGTSPLSTAGIP